MEEKGARGAGLDLAGWRAGRFGRSEVQLALNDATGASRVGQRERVRGRTAASLASSVAIPYVVLRLSAFGSPSLLHIDNESDWLADLLCLHIVSLFGVLILLRVVAL